jgi:acyl-CoA thioesterase-1
MDDTRRSFPTRRALIATGLAAAATPALAARGKVVTMLGDSITAGYGLPARDALPAQLQAALNALHVDAVVRAAGVSGDTSADGADRVDFSVRPDTRVVVVALGGNDLLQGLDPKATYANLEKIITRLKARHMGVVLAGLAAPVEIGRGYAKDFDAVFPALARKFGVALYPDLLAGVERNPSLNQGDAIHPNARGVAIIARRLAPLVARTLAQQP